MESSRPMRLAIVDADSGFVTVLAKRAETAGWQCVVRSEPLTPAALAAMKVNALVVDLKLLGRDAWVFLEDISEELPGLGVVVCTTDTSTAVRVRGLRLGADDWVTKPAHPAEVLARVEAVVRNRDAASPRPDDMPIIAADLEIRRDQFEAFAVGRPAHLTRREFELLYLLAGGRGLVHEREDIYARVWGYGMAHGDRSVDVFVRKIRQKLEVISPRWRYIHTHFGIGYRFEPELSEDAAAALPVTGTGGTTTEQSPQPRSTPSASA